MPTQKNLSLGDFYKRDGSHLPLREGFNDKTVIFKKSGNPEAKYRVMSFLY